MPRKTALQRAKERIISLEEDNNQFSRKAAFFDELVKAIVESDAFKSELHTLVDEEVGMAIDDLTISR